MELMMMKRNLKLIYCIYCVISSCLEFEIGAHCLRELPRATVPAAASSTRHMWQQQYPTGTLADTGSCNRPTILRPASDSDVATSEQSGNAATETTASPAVTLPNYVYQCAAKRESSPSKPSASSTNIDLTTCNEVHQVEQPTTVQTVILQLSKKFKG